jgi:hypothetical protein
MQARRSMALSLSAAVIAALALASCGDDDDDDNDPVPPPQAKTCEELNGMSMTAASIGLPTSGAVVTSTAVVPAAGAGPAAVGEYCRVQGDIKPVDPDAPSIKFQVNLPSNWNRKAMMFGGGGYNGTIAAGTGNVPAGPVDRQVPLGAGYATFGSDSGHQAGPAASRDGSFGANDEALRNFAGDALKKTRDVAVAIIKARYADDVQRTYFAGGSTGGREALLAVGSWPQDFDGAIVLYPAWNAVAINLAFGRITQELAKPGAYPSRPKRKVLLDASLEACDALDGVQDGLVSNVSACETRFDPASATRNGARIRCVNGQDTGDTCLSDAQIAAFKVINSPLVLGYTLPSGETGYPGFTTWGTDFGIPNANPLQPTVVTLSLGTNQPANPMPPVALPESPPYGSTFWDQFVKYFVTRDPTFNSLSLDPASPGPWQARIVELAGIQSADPTRLAAFRAKGGKILMAHGKHDALVSNRASQDFVNRLRVSMGDTRNFLRYYEIPGYGHATSTVFNASWDSLTTLEAWVEQGVEPGPQVVADSVGVPGRTRPLCEYPAWPRYTGTGGPDVATSFTCATQ